MPERTRSVAVIPARGGSKRIVRKNSRNFLGVPLIVRTIRTVLASDLFERVVVSTDDNEIADLSRAAGADVPFVRPAEYATDEAPTAPVIVHAIEQIESIYGMGIDFVCVVYPAAVLLTPGDLVRAAALLTADDSDAVISTIEFPSAIERALRVNDAGFIEMRWPEHRFTRSQDLPTHVYDAGQFYWTRPKYWSEQISGKPYSDQRVLSYPMHRWQAVDIDTEDDWTFAEKLFELNAIN
ncbi:MAG: pseudaminic acid cytidylyltransferase [Actinomycetia bacterium]|nr:pseudaminic acid cytidylyltransferase [Actinomycetes bacterium]